MPHWRLDYYDPKMQVLSLVMDVCALIVNNNLANMLWSSGGVGHVNDCSVN